jgi:glucosamine-6-phosphate deaminase
MEIIISPDAAALGQSAGAAAAATLRQTLTEKGEANIILATGASQFATLTQLISEPGIDWSRVRMFHLDEYIGLPVTHPASFRKYLQERFLQQVPPLKAAYLINGETDPAAECKRVGDLIRQYPIDLALVGIGENGHLAFNDPPADFETEEPYIVVTLDEACRRQQMGEGWFASLEEVPQQAISMSIRQILRAKAIIGSVPDARKAAAVQACLENAISPLYPASILRQHANCTLYLDTASAALFNH